MLLLLLLLAIAVATVVVSVDGGGAGFCSAKRYLDDCWLIESDAVDDNEA